MRKHLSLLVLIPLCLLFALPLSALQEKSRVLLPFGDGEGQIGIMPMDQGFWAPPFFVVKADGEIVVADCLHQRLNRYSPAGKWLGSLPCPNLTTRLRFFDWNETSQSYLTMNDQTIALLDKTGAQIASYDFGLNIPDRLWLGAGNVYAVLRVEGKRFTVKFDYNLNNPSELSLNYHGNSIPVFRTDFSGYFAFTIEDSKSFGKSNPQLPGEAILNKINPKFSLWSTSSNGHFSFYIIDTQFKLIKQDELFLEKHMPADATQTWVSQGLDLLYLPFFSEAGLTIVAYEFP